MNAKLQLLLRIMKKPLKAIVEFLRYLSYSLVGKIKLQFSVLRSRNIDCSLSEMFGKNDELYC